MNENIIQLRGKKNSMMAKWNLKVSVDFFYSYHLSKNLKKEMDLLGILPSDSFFKGNYNKE